jgi:hypothetical protein
MYVVALLHSIGREFSIIEETRDTMYENKRAGVSTRLDYSYVHITGPVSSSFSTVLPKLWATGVEYFGRRLRSSSVLHVYDLHHRVA